MQIDLLPNLHSSGGRKNVLTAISVFSRYILAYPLKFESAINVANMHTYQQHSLLTKELRLLPGLMRMLHIFWELH